MQDFSIHTFAYPLPSSFPLFSAHGAEQLLISGQRPNPLETTTVLSSITTSTKTARRFERYATFIDKSIKRQPYTALSMGLNSDDMKELANDLWSIHDNVGEF